MSDTTYNCEFQVEGMHCAACELVIEKKVSKLSGVEKVNAILASNKLKLKISPNTDVDNLRNEINASIADSGYKLVNVLSARAVPFQQLGIAFVTAMILVILFVALQSSGVMTNITGEQSDLTFAFLVGLVASVSSCMAVVGGLVLTISSSYALQKKAKTIPLFLFHIARLVGFLILGGVTGLLGSAFTLSAFTTFVISLILFVVMIVMGLNMLDVFPVLKKFQLHMPKFIAAKSVNTENVSGALAPIALGALTFFLPCGFTQSMQVYALSTGSFINGALTMFVFALGTLPALGLISFASTRLSNGLNSGLFFKTAAFLILFFALFNFLGALAAIGIIQPVFNF